MKKDKRKEEIKGFVLTIGFAAVVLTGVLLTISLIQIGLVGRAFFYSGSSIDLENYSYPFVEDQEINTLIAVGENAPTEDAISAQAIYNGLLQDSDYDNCPDVYNPDQADADGDGIGDACEVAP